MFLLRTLNGAEMATVTAFKKVRVAFENLPIKAECQLKYLKVVAVRVLPLSPGTTETPSE